MSRDDIYNLISISYDWLGIVTEMLVLCDSRAYRAFYILNWIYRYLTEQRFTRWICKFLEVQPVLFVCNYLQWFFKVEFPFAFLFLL